MTLLIKNVQLIDGTGRPPVKADILLKNEKISAVGNFPKYKADDTIDGMGAYCAPGFIDANNSSDRHLTLFSNPAQANLLLQGVTTAIGGTNGISLAPLLYGSLESIYEYADINKLNVNWHTVEEFIKVMEQKMFGVNFGTMAGYTTIKQAIVGGEVRDFSANELKVFNLLLEKSFAEGIFGLSVDLNKGYGGQASDGEIKNIMEPVNKFKGIFSVNLRGGKNKLLSSVNEIINLAKETGAKIFINNFAPLIGFDKDYEEALNLFNENSDKADVYFNISPSDTGVYALRDFLPESVTEAEKENLVKKREWNPELEEKIIKDMERIKGEDVVILNAPRNEYLVGKSLKEFCVNRNLTITKGILALMRLTGFKASVLYKNVNLKKAVSALSHNRAIISSNFPKLLELAEKENILPLEKAIYKITGLPAQKLGLNSRGLVRDGYFADLVIFRDAEVREVIVNGKRAVKDGQFQNVLAGRIIKKS